MKSKTLERALKKSIMLRFLLTAVLVSLLYLVLLYLSFTALRTFLSNLLLPLLGTQMYYSLMDTKVFWLTFGYVVVMGVVIYRTISRTIGYVTPIAESVDMVFNKEDAPILLPKELEDVQFKLNSIKYSALNSERLAREAEQRKNDLVVYLAHDLKTPLTSVIGYVSLLQEAPDMPASQRAKYTGIALEKAYRLEQLINEFFEITRFNLQSITLETNKIHLTVMLYQIADEFYPMLAEKDLTLSTELEENLILYADADKLARVMDNLLRNAVNYSYPSTDIRLTAAREGDAVRITVSNAGDPISDAQLSRLFEKFFRLDSARQSRTGGAGLGLAIAKQIVELHHGTITAASSAERTIFTVRLPAAPPDGRPEGQFGGSSK